MGKHYPEMQSSMTIAALLIFDAKIKISLAGVRSRARETHAKRLIQYFLLCTFTETYLFPCKNASDN